MTRPARIGLSALIAFAIAFLVAGVAVGGSSDQPAAKSERADQTYGGRRPAGPY